MSSPFALQWEWLPPFDKTTEGYAFASLEIQVEGCVATELEDFQSQTIRKGMFVSAYPLAMFFAANWWRLRWEPMYTGDISQWRMHHSLAAAGEGYVWPDIAFASDGEFILITAKQTASTASAPVRFITDLARWIPVDAFEKAVSHFIEGVLARLETLGMDATDLADLWHDVLFERTDAQTALLRRLEALAGYDPDEAPPCFINGLINAAAISGWPPIQELAAASRKRVLNDLTTLQEAIPSRGVDFHVADLERIIKETKGSIVDCSIPPWQRGVNVARTARKIWRLNGQPVPNQLLAELSGLPTKSLEHHPGVGSVLSSPYSAASWDPEKNVRQMILNRKPVSSRRFAVCRLLGDILCLDSPRISAATDAATSRQKFQRAFAQEMLCPFESLMGFLDNRLPYEDDIEDAADYFQVSPRLVHVTLVNHGVLPRETINRF